MNKISSDVLESKAYEMVKKMILSNKLVAGEKIVQDKLALLLGISRTPLRSALQRLEAEYLVESLPRRGMIVKRFSKKELINIYDCRMGFETTAVRLFIENAGNGALEKLESFFAPFTSLKEIDIKKYQKADTKFHAYLVEKSENEYLIRLFNQGNITEFINRIGLVRPPKETFSEHVEIINAILAKDFKKAEEASRNHLMKSRALILNQADGI